MRYLLLLLALALSPLMRIHAQAPSQQPGSIPLSDECLLTTTDETWTTIGLSTEQMEEVKAIQTLCETDCTALQERGGSDPALAGAMLEKHRSSVRGILSKDQYDKWIAWCGTRPAKG